MKLHPNQIGALRFIQRERQRDDPPTIREIAKFLDIGTTTVNHHIDELCKSGLLTRKPRRARSFKVTEAGVEAIALSLLKPEQRLFYLDKTCPSCGASIKETKPGLFQCIFDGTLHGMNRWWQEALDTARHGNY